MGTNYYLHRNTCPHCGRGDEPYHIGKSSAGWCFSLHVDPEEGIQSLDDLKQAMSCDGVAIRNEYGEIITTDEMIAIITKRGPREVERTPFGYSSWEEFHQHNSSEMGPNGMLRHRIDRYCVGHGDGTWDLLSGEFS